MSIDLSKGSEWRKWDLHVHTSISYDAYKGSDSDNLLIEKLHSNNISVIAITDHFAINKDKIEHLRSLASDIVFFPGVELRTDKGSCNIHVILLFDPLINLRDLEEDFNVFKRNKAKNVDNNDTIFWDYNDILEFANSHNGLISIHAGSKSQGIDDTIKNNTKFQQAIKNDYDKTVDIYEVSNLVDIEDYNTYVFPDLNFKRPLIICSDNHNPKKYEEDHRNLWLWIKADPTFEGLKQILKEPEERVLIGEKPDIFLKTAQNKTRYIDKLSIHAIDDYTGSNGNWFDNEVCLNKELVSIIGNKGNGKSAIADIIANCCNSHEQDYFSFLNPEKFRDGKLANNFEATVTLFDGTELKRNLSDGDLPSEVSNVKYLPQGYFENLCNDFQKDENLKKEIEEVVFQYIDEAQRLGSASFQELISKKTEVTNQAIEEIKTKLVQLNSDIISLESKENEKYLQHIDSEIKQREQEINALETPVEVPCPDSNSEATQQTVSEINTINGKIQELQSQIDNTSTKKNELALKIEEIKNFLIQLSELEQKVQSFVYEKEKLITDLGLNINDIVKISISSKIVQNKLDEKKNEYNSLNTQTDPKTESSLTSNLNKLQDELAQKENLLEGPQKQYQAYLKEKQLYEETKKNLEGSLENPVPNTLNWFKAEKKYINENLQNDLQSKYQERDDLIREIYTKKQSVIEVYKSIKERIEQKISSNQNLLEGYEINIDASLELENDFSSKVLTYISKNIKGSFKGTQEGESLLKKLIKDNPVQSEDGIIALCKSIIDALKSDLSKGNERRFIDDQVKDMQGFYAYLFSLDYLTYNYQLKLGDKKLSLLSPGEKGALLLIFYLLLDMDNRPLILDQPEDNLDNNSVANILVNFIKEAKKNRQIIMVTHNPNLAVVADSEQIIYVDIDKKNDNTFKIESGSIENPDINRHIVDVLEGAMPAFRKRDSKYIQ